jgi:hypothetical protein
MSFINWGNETPEQRARRYRLEDDAIFEQRAAAIMAAAATATGSGRLADPSLNSYVETDYIENYFE